MKSVQITLNLENDAFKPTPKPEICRILRELADKIEKMSIFKYKMNVPVLDINGNCVGSLETLSQKDL